MHAAGPDLGCLFFRKRGHTGSYGYCVNKKKTLTQKNYESLKLRSREGERRGEPGPTQLDTTNDRIKGKETRHA
eukprot:1154264-Pelagomonas_calceolata.AAC.3